MCARFDKIFVKYVFLILLLTIKLEALFKITTVECRSLDEKFVEFDYCRLKEIRRGLSEFSFRLNLLQRVDAVTVKYALLRKFTLYRTFIRNRTIDLCNFMENRKRWGVFNVFFNTFKNYININHTCPYTGIIIMDKFTLKHNDVRIPLLSGEYRVITDWVLNTILRLRVSVSFVLDESNFYNFNSSKL